MGSAAQNGLAVNEVFERFGSQKGCRMVVVSDGTLHGYELHVYKALSYKKIGGEVEPYLKRDQEQATKIYEVVDNGRISSGYYMMPSLKNGMNRFVLYSRKAGGDGTLIYIEGHLTASDIMKLCYAKW